MGSERGRSAPSPDTSRRHLRHSSHSPPRVITLTWLLGLMLIVPVLVCGQTPTPEASPAPGLSRTDIVFVPYDRMKGPEWGKDQSILVPYAEFLRLKKAAEERPEAPDFRPLASLVQADYAGSVVGEVAEFELSLTIEVLARPKDTLEIPLPFKNVAVERAEVEGPTASLVPLEKEPGIRLLLRGEGTRTVRLSLIIPLISEGANKRLAFETPRAAASSLELAIEEEVILVPVHNATPAVVSKTEEGKSLIRASAGSQERVLLVFRPRAEKTGAAAQTRFAVHQDNTFNVAARLVTVGAAINVRMLTGSLSSLTVTIPQGAELQNVAGPFVKDWSAPDEAGKVTVSLVEERSEDFSFHFQLLLDTSASDAQVEIPELRVPEAVSESGLVRLRPEGELTIWTEEAEGIEVTSLPPRAPLTMKAYQFEQPGWKLTISRVPIPSRVRSQGLILYEVTEQFVRIHSRHSLTIGGRGVFEQTFLVPSGYTLREAGPPELVAGFRQQGNQVEINLRGEQRASFMVELRLQRERAAGETRITLEPLVVMGAEEDAGNIVLATPRALKATEIRASGLEPTDVRTLMEQLASLQSPELIPVLGYRYVTADFKAVVAIERQRTRMTCETARLVTILPSLMRLGTTLNYQIEFSAADEFHVLLPSSVGEDVQFSGPDIKEKAHAPFMRPRTAEEGLTTWTVRLQRPTLGSYQLHVSFEVPLSGAESGETLTVTVPTVRAGKVARETGFIGISRGENLEVQVAEAEGLEARDVKELPPSLATSFLGFRYFDPRRHSLQLQLVRHELETVLGAVIRRVHMETVLNDQGEAVHEVIFEVQNNREQYLEIKLPARMEIWLAFVRGAPVRPITRQADGARLVELTKTESRDMAFRVRLILRESSAGGPLGAHGKLFFTPPQPLNLPILRTTWKLYLPREYRYIDFDGTMRLERGGRPSWIEPAAERLLNDLPASVAGGIAQPALQPPVAQAPIQYERTETEEERRARLQGAALDVPIVREGLQFVFSKLSGMGTIEISYWKRKPLLIFQGFVGVIIFLLVMVLMGIGKRPLLGFIAVVLFFILASLTDGLTGRLSATALSTSTVAFVIGLLVYAARRSKSEKTPTAVEPAQENQATSIE